jgi:hypothetical protein
MRTRLRLAEILLNETENVDMADDLLSKGVSFPSLTALILDSENAKGFSGCENTDSRFLNFTT